MGLSVQIKKELQKRKVQLEKFSKEALELAHQGEKKLKKVSQFGKMHINSTAVHLKKDHLYYLIGEEYVRAKYPAVPNEKLKKLIGEYHKVDREQKQILRNLKALHKKS